MPRLLETSIALTTFGTITSPPFTCIGPPGKIKSFCRKKNATPNKYKKFQRLINGEESRKKEMEKKTKKSIYKIQYLHVNYEKGSVLPL